MFTGAESMLKVNTVHHIVNSITGSQVSLSEQPLQHDPSLNNLSVMYQSVLNIGYFKYLLNILFFFFLFRLYILETLEKAHEGMVNR